jgi:hypothetical protein
MIVEYILRWKVILQNISSQFKKYVFIFIYYNNNNNVLVVYYAIVMY